MVVLIECLDKVFLFANMNIHYAIPLSNHKPHKILDTFQILSSEICDFFVNWYIQHDHFLPSVVHAVLHTYTYLIP